MKTFLYQSQLWLPQPPEAVFTFFADTRNLEQITPPFLKFEVLTRAPIVMRAGTLIDYRLRVHGYPIRWRTEITEWNQSFVDLALMVPFASRKFVK